MWARERCLREAKRVLRQPEDAEDAVQEALTRAWRQRRSCRTPEAPLPWLLQITRNESLRLLGRRRQRQGHESPEPSRHELRADEPGPEARVGELDLARAMAFLQPEERVLIGLRYVMDLTQPAAARALGLPEGTAKVRLHRIRARLRAELEA